MSSYRFTPQVSTDLVEIWDYIARESVDAADRVEAAIYEACAFLAEEPLRGHIRKDLTDLPLRFWVVQRHPRYIVVYAPGTQPLAIIRILQGARDILAALSPSARA